MDHQQVGRLWNANADAWTKLARAGYDVYRDYLNTPAFFDMLPAALRKAGVSAELHLFAKGGHAFGLRRTELPITRWPELVEAWLRTIGMLSE